MMGTYSVSATKKIFELNHTKGLTVVVSILFWVTFYYCGCSSSENIKVQQESNAVLAKIDDVVITKEEFEKQIEQSPYFRKLIKAGPDKKFEILDKIIELRLLLKEAKTLNINIDQEFILRPEEFRKCSIIQELKKKFFEGIEVNEGEILDYYNKHKDGFVRKPQRRVYHVLFEIDSSPGTNGKILAHQKAKEFIDRINESRKDKQDIFQSIFRLADEYSDRDTKGRRWGDLGWISQGKLDSELDKAIFSLKQVGDYMLVETNLGYHFLQLMDIRPPKIYTFGEARKTISDKIKYTKFNQYLKKLMQELRAKSDIIINNQLLRNMSFKRENIRDMAEENKMVLLRGGEFCLGSTGQEIDEKVQLYNTFLGKYFGYNRRELFTDENYNEVTVAPFYIDKNEVTIGQYKEFIKATKHQAFPKWVSQYSPQNNYPVMGVDWYDVGDYCQWKNKRLPTYEEWEFAAKGKVRRRFPWGNEMPTGERANYADVNTTHSWKDKTHNDGYRYAAPIGNYPAGQTPEGIYDLAGNVSEWTATVEQESGKAVVKGGSFNNHWLDLMGSDYRVNDRDTRYFIGFRCAKDVKPPLGKLDLPSDFIPLVTTVYPDFSGMVKNNFRGGGLIHEDSREIKHYPVIMIHSNARDFTDWMGADTGNTSGKINVYKKFIDAGFIPAELWLFQYAQQDVQMRNIEELTDGLRKFINAVLWYTGADKIQILTHEEGAVLAQATLKKYNLYNLIYAVVCISSPFHGNDNYTYTQCLNGYPVNCNLSPDSDFLQELNSSDETPYNILENENKANFAVKYMTISTTGTNSGQLQGAINLEFDDLNFDGLRCSEATSEIFIPFLSDPTRVYNSEFDKDKDGFMGENTGGPDCNDNKADIFPGAMEIAGDNIDQDCNYMDRAPWGGRDAEVSIKYMVK